MKEIKLNPGNSNKCEAHYHCPECEHLLMCADDDEAWIGDTPEK